MRRTKKSERKSYFSIQQKQKQKSQTHSRRRDRNAGIARLRV